ncbi:MAG: hypothetical protein MUC49_15230 [Raineya sp.]|jgi:hypothetical protein|nr:hypothetical protein [Raineya sp.]
MNYKQRLQEMIMSLQKNPNVDILEVKINEGIDEEKLQNLLANHQKKHKIDLPQSFINLYRQINGFKLEWKPKKEMLVEMDGEPEKWNLDTCYTEFFPLQNVLIDTKDEVYWDDEETELKMAFQFYIDYEMEMQGTWLLGTGKKLYLYYIDNQGEDVREIKLDFEIFFELYLASRGFFCWQEAILPKIETLQDINYEVFHAWMPALFTDFKPELFKRPKTSLSKF